MHRTICGLAVAFFSAAAAAAPLTVGTHDGLVLTVAEDGALDGVTLDGAALPLLGQGGFFVSEVTPSMAPLPYDGRTRAGEAVRGTAVQSAANEVTLEATLSGGVKVTAVLKGGPALTIDGRIENQNGGDRAFTVYFRVPVDAEGWTWSSMLDDARAVAAGARLYDSFDWFQAYRSTTSARPLVALSRGASGMALAIPPSHPSIYRLSYEAPHGFQVEWEVATAPEPTRFPNAAPVHAILYRVDSAWGYRAALKRLYLLFPRLWVKRAQSGSWYYDDSGNVESIATPEDFALRFVETYSWESAYTRAHGFYMLKYIEPWNDHLERSPAGLEEWAVDSPLNQVWALISKGQPRQITAQAALLSGTIGRDGDYGGYSDPANFTDNEGTHRYVLNPDRELPNDRGFTALFTDVGRVLNRAQSVEEYELFREWGRAPGPGDSYSGLYLDSTNSTGSGWAGWHLFNFRRSHFPTTKVPLVFDPESGKVALSQALSSVESVRHFAELTHERGGVVMANGMPDPFVFYTGAWCDFLSAGEWYGGDLSMHRQVRAALYSKPSSFLFNSAVTDEQFQHALLYAMFPGGAGLEANRAVYKRWAKLLAEVGDAGWEPLTFARTDDAGVLVERYGRLDQGTLRFVVHREEGAGGAARLRLDKAELGVVAGVQVSARDAVKAQALSVEDAGTFLEIPLQLADEQSAVVEVALTQGAAGPTAGETLPVPVAPTDPGTEPEPEEPCTGELPSRCGEVPEVPEGPEEPVPGPIGEGRRCGCASGNGGAAAAALVALMWAARLRRRRARHGA